MWHEFCYRLELNRCLKLLAFIWQNPAGAYRGLSIVFSTGVHNESNVSNFRSVYIGVDLAGLLGGRMASAEGGSVPRWVGYGEGCLQPTKGFGGASWAPPAGSGAEPRPKTDFGVFWTLTFCTYMTKSGVQFALASPAPNFFFLGGGTCPPRDLRPWVSIFLCSRLGCEIVWWRIVFKSRYHSVQLSHSEELGWHLP